MKKESKKDAESAYFSEEFLKKYGPDIASLVGARGLSGGISTEDEAKLRQYNTDFDEVLAEASVWINGEVSHRTVSDTLRMDLERKARGEAFENGFNTTLKER